MTQIKYKPGISALLTCSVSSESNLYASCSSSGKIVYINTAFFQKNPKIMKLHKSKINGSMFFKNLFLTISSDKTCILWNHETLEKIRTLNLTSNSGKDVDTIDDKILTTEQTGNCKLWDQRVSDSISSIYHGIPIQNAKFFVDSEKFISCSVFSDIFLWDLRNSKKPFSFFSLKKKTKSISSFCFSKNSSCFFCLDSNGQIIKWGLDFHKPALKIKTFKQTNSTCPPSDCLDLSISADSLGKFIGHGNFKGDFFIRDQKTGEFFQNFQCHRGKVNQVIFDKNNRLVVSCGEDGFLFMNVINK